MTKPLVLYPGANIFIGAKDSPYANPPLICASKASHYKRMGWKAGDHRESPFYFGKLEDDWLTINWVDGPACLYDWSARLWPDIFDLIDEWRAEGRPVTVVCDQGLSRSPTLVMAYLAKRTDLLPDDFEAAAAEFGQHYPWQPRADGIAGWVRDHWDSLDTRPPRHLGATNPNY